MPWLDDGVANQLEAGLAPAEPRKLRLLAGKVPSEQEQELESLPRHPTGQPIPLIPICTEADADVMPAKQQSGGAQ